LLFGESGVGELLSFSAKAEIVLKHPDLTCRVLSGGEDITVKGQAVEDVVDTTAAGDSFAAAYLAARLSGTDLEASAKAGHRLAGQVVRYRGAIIPSEGMPR
jgi:2-dehydro-3-deoxygluconokinase